MIRRILHIILISLLILPGCNNEEDRSLIGPEKKEDSFSRTVIVYIARDNNLSGNQEEKISAMLEGWNGEGGNLVIYQDKRNTLPCLIEAFEIDGELQERVVEVYEEENSASAEVFGRVIKDVVERYPADSYGLIFFSHAHGWLPENTFSQPRSIGQDGSSFIELADFAAAIPDNLFDFIVFEACFMAGIEVVYELKDKTDYILASSAEIVSPGFKLIYMEEMNCFFEEEANLTRFAQKAYEWVEEQTGDYQSGTLSVIKTANIEALKDFLKENIDWTVQVSLNDIQYFDRNSYHLFFDFQDYFSYLIPENKQETFSDLISDCVIYEAATAYFFQRLKLEQHSGLTTYIIQDRFTYMNEVYKTLKWYNALID